MIILCVIGTIEFQAIFLKIDNSDIFWSFKCVGIIIPDKFETGIEWFTYPSSNKPDYELV